MQLRPYQHTLKQDIYQAWQTNRNVLAIAPTGGGKTAIFTNIMAEHNGACWAIEHRQELVSQTSVALGRFNVKHNIVGPKSVVRWIVQLHMEEFGRSFYDPNSNRVVAGVDTLLARSKDLAAATQQATLWVQDEGHHILKTNKWGRAAELFPNARGLGVTANSFRADGKGLGRHADGIMDALVVGPGMRELIDAGYLTDYRIFAPPSDLDLTGVAISAATGDYSRNQLKIRIQKSHVVGDVVAHYLRLARGKLGITFATDVETATDIARRFNEAGVPAEVVSAKTPDRMRTEIMRRFKNRELRQVVNVDLFGEGYDLPAIEVVSMARPTESLNLYCQQFGRGLRILAGKGKAIIIDHVGNVTRHGLPDAYREWTLNRREKRSRGTRDPSVLPVRGCPQCTSLYEAIYKACPYCGYAPEPASRSGPKYVDGDLTELDASALSAMRGEINKIDIPAAIVRTKMERAGMSGIAAAGVAKRHSVRQEAQGLLREAIAWWAGHQRAVGRKDTESYRLFYHTFGTDVMTAQTLGRPGAEELTGRINKIIGRV